MAESTAELTESLVNTVRQKLKNLLETILNSDLRDDTNGSSGAFLREIDEAIGLLTCLRKLESDSDTSSSSASVEIPKEFVCSLSKKIMIDPVIIASGQTYEKRCITEWLRHERTCPITKEVLSHSLCTPNSLVSEMITQWCRLNGFDRPEPSEETVTELFTDDLESLLHQVSSYATTVEVKTKAAEEIRLRTKKFPNVRVFFVSQLRDPVSRLITLPVTLGEEVDALPELQEIIIATLFNISAPDKNKTVIAENKYVIPLLTKSLRKGTATTRRNSALTLMSLSVIDSNKIIIGNSETLEALVELMKEGDVLTTKEAASAVFNLCLVLDNKEKAIKAGLVPVLANKIKEGSNVDELVALMTLVSTHKQAIDEIESLGFVCDLFGILRNQSGGSVTSENSAVIIFNMIDRNRGKSVMKVFEEEEKQHGTFTKLMAQGSDRAVRKAEAVLKLIKKFAAGKGLMI
ncbi:unnamed protein product [Cochlearia groenlandica]